MCGPDQTIFAVATAPGKAGVAVVRVSGPLAFHVVGLITRKPLPDVRALVRRRLYGSAGLIDDALVAVFKQGKSFTGEDVAEFHVHGSTAVLNALLKTLGETPGLRIAVPGEFTRRALDNDCMDLVQVEALADLIDAETELQHRQALAGVDGQLSGFAKQWREALVHCLALITATLDFADEEDAPVSVEDEISAGVRLTLDAVKTAVDGAKSGERVREGFTVALVGSPNAGKSTLMNAIVRREASITSPYAGTTRDVIEIACDFDGVPVRLQDLAGLREALDPVEKIGVERANQKAETADLRLFIESADAPLGDLVSLQQDGDIRVWAKSDVGAGIGGINVSSVNGVGIQDLIEEIAGELRARVTGLEIVARKRQLASLENCSDYLRQVENCSDLEVQAELLRLSLEELGFLVGDVGVEDVLDEVFSRFCMGK